MSSPFESLPVSFTPETIDMVNQKYIQMQNDGDILLDIGLSNSNKAEAVNSILSHIADFPNDVNDDIVIRLATLTLSWVEGLNNA